MNDSAPAETGMRDKLLLLVDGQVFNNVIIGIIVMNSIVIGMQTSDRIVAAFGSVLDVLDTLFLTIFVMELMARMIAYGSGFVKRPWSVFDFIVVGIALTPGAEAFSVVRALRILRALRLISQVPTMRVVVEALLRSLPGLGSTAILLMLIFYVGGVMTTVLFKSAFPEFFGDLGSSIYSLFQIMTLESWSMGIVRPVMVEYPYAWMFFVPFVIITSILVLNLVVAIVVDSMQSAKEMMAEEGRVEREAAGEPAEATLESIQLEMRALRDEVRALRAERGES
jgi:voltage-gated sodium channel